MFDHLSTDEIREHILRLRKQLREPSGIAHTLDDIAVETRELGDLVTEYMHRRNAPAPAEYIDYQRELTDPFGY